MELFAASDAHGFDLILMDVMMPVMDGTHLKTVKGRRGFAGLKKISFREKKGNVITMRAIEDRRSIRKYTDQSVSREQIEAVVRAAALAPSAKNRQPWKYLVYTGVSKEKLLDAMENGLKKEQESHALLPNSAFGLPNAFQTLSVMRQAPVILIVMDPDGVSPYEPVDSDRRLAEICDSLSIGASIQNLLLEAEELGLGTLWIANTCFAYNDLTAFLQEKGQLIGAVALGYAAESPHTRPRKKLTEILEFR